MRSQTSTPEEFNFVISFSLIWLTLPILADNFHVHFCNDVTELLCFFKICRSEIPICLTFNKQGLNTIIPVSLCKQISPISGFRTQSHFSFGFGERRVILDQFRKKYKFVFFRITTKSPLAKGNSFTRYRRRCFLLLYIRSGYALQVYGIVFAAWLARQYLPPSLFLFIAITIYALVKRDAAQRCENRVDP